MEKERLKLIVRNLELLVDSLKAEVYSDPSAYMDKRENFDDPPHYGDYDEVFNDDNDDYDDSVTNRINNSYRLTNDDDGDGL